MKRGLFSLLHTNSHHIIRVILGRALALEYLYCKNRQRIYCDSCLLQKRPTPILAYVNIPGNPLLIDLPPYSLIRALSGTITQKEIRPTP